MASRNGAYSADTALGPFSLGLPMRGLQSIHPLPPSPSAPAMHLSVRSHPPRRFQQKASSRPGHLPPTSLPPIFTSPFLPLISPQYVQRPPPLFISQTAKSFALPNKPHHEKRFHCDQTFLNRSPHITLDPPRLSLIVCATTAVLIPHAALGSPTKDLPISTTHPILSAAQTLRHHTTDNTDNQDDNDDISPCSTIQI